AQVAPDRQVDVVGNEPDASVAQGHLDPARVVTTRRHHVRGGGGRTRAGRVGRQRVAVTGAIAGDVLDHGRGRGGGREERLAGGRGTPPGEATQVAPLALSHLQHENGVAGAVGQVRESELLARRERGAAKRDPLKRVLVVARVPVVDHVVVR